MSRKYRNDKKKMLHSLPYKDQYYKILYCKRLITSLLYFRPIGKYFSCVKYGKRYENENYILDLKEQELVFKSVAKRKKDHFIQRLMDRFGIVLNKWEINRNGFKTNSS